ncbi:hypothetical protein TNCV_2871151 [Trichonephila clavipes]|nr:hypothetical protein TNCV_2871151 [Trichonephila clavipes]
MPTPNTNHPFSLWKFHNLESCFTDFKYVPKKVKIIDEQQCKRRPINIVDGLKEQYEESATPLEQPLYTVSSPIM